MRFATTEAAVEQDNSALTLSCTDAIFENAKFVKVVVRVAVPNFAVRLPSLAHPPASVMSAAENAPIRHGRATPPPTQIPPRSLKRRWTRV